MNSGRKLKVLHLTSHLDVGGITRYTLLLGSTMAARGHSVEVLSAGGNMKDFFGRAGIRTHDFPVRKKNILDPSLYSSFPGITRLIREEKYDILHAHTRVTQALAFFLGKKTKTPVVTTCHGFFKYNAGRRFFPFWGDRTVAISAPVAKHLESLHRVPASNIRIISNAIDLEECARAVSQWKPEEVRARYGVPPGAIVLTSVGRLVQDKGNEIFLRAAAQILPVYPEIFLLIVGDGRERENLEKLIRELGLSARAKILPGVQDTSPVLAATDIFVHPAFYREGFGLGIAEAMAFGKPVVITNIPAVNQIFRPGECSVMAEPADVSSLAGAIRFLLEAPGEKNRIAEEGRKLVRSMCSPARLADETEAVYRELVNA